MERGAAGAGLRRRRTQQLVRDGENGLLFEPDNLSSLLNAYRTLSRYGLRSNHNQRPTRSLDPLQLRCHEQPARRVLPREHRRTEQLNVNGAKTERVPPPVPRAAVNARTPGYRG